MTLPLRGNEHLPGPLVEFNNFALVKFGRACRAVSMTCGRVSIRFCGTLLTPMHGLKPGLAFKRASIAADHFATLANRLAGPTFRAPAFTR